MSTDLSHGSSPSSGSPSDASNSTPCAVAAKHYYFVDCFCGHFVAYFSNLVPKFPAGLTNIKTPKLLTLLLYCCCRASCVVFFNCFAPPFIHGDRCATFKIVMRYWALAGAMYAYEAIHVREKTPCSFFVVIAQVNTGTRKSPKRVPSDAILASRLSRHGSKCPFYLLVSLDVVRTLHVYRTDAPVATITSLVMRGLASETLSSGSQRGRPSGIQV